jgi:asparaginyl-tRNA synthetase
VLKNAISPELWEQLKALGQESALVIKGTVRADSRAPGGFEIDVIDAEVLQQVHDYPITPKEHGTEFLMDHRHLWLRSRRQHAVLKVRHTVVQAVRNFLDNDGFTLWIRRSSRPRLVKERRRSLKSTTSMVKRRISRSRVNFTTKRQRRRSERFTVSVRRSGGEIKDTPTPDGVLDGRAGDGVCDARRRDDLSERLLSYIAARVLEQRSEELKVLERIRRNSKPSCRRFRGSLRRCGEDAARRI